MMAQRLHQPNFPPFPSGPSQMVHAQGQPFAPAPAHLQQSHPLQQPSSHALSHGTSTNFPAAFDQSYQHASASTPAVPQLVSSSPSVSQSQFQFPQQYIGTSYASQQLSQSAVPSSVGIGYQTIPPMLPVLQPGMLPIQEMPCNVIQGQGGPNQAIQPSSQSITFNAAPSSMTQLQGPQNPPASSHQSVPPWQITSQQPPSLQGGTYQVAPPQSPAHVSQPAAPFLQSDVRFPQPATPFSQSAHLAVPQKPFPMRDPSFRQQVPGTLNSHGTNQANRLDPFSPDVNAHNTIQNVNQTQMHPNQAISVPNQECYNLPSHSSMSGPYSHEETLYQSDWISYPSNHSSQSGVPSRRGQGDRRQYEHDNQRRDWATREDRGAKERKEWRDEDMRRESKDFTSRGEYDHSLRDDERSRRMEERFERQDSKSKRPDSSPSPQVSKQSRKAGDKSQGYIERNIHSKESADPKGKSDRLERSDRKEGSPGRRKESDWRKDRGTRKDDDRSSERRREHERNMDRNDRRTRNRDSYPGSDSRAFKSGRYDTNNDKEKQRESRLAEQREYSSTKDNKDPSRKSEREEYSFRGEREGRRVLQEQMRHSQRGRDDYASRGDARDGSRDRRKEEPSWEDRRDREERRDRWRDRIERNGRENSGSPDTSGRSSSRKSSGRWDNFTDQLTEEKERENELNSLIKSDDAVVTEKSEGATWVQSSSKENLYTSDPTKQKDGSTVAATEVLKTSLERFKTEILDRCKAARENQPKFVNKYLEKIMKPSGHHCHSCEGDDDSDSSSSSSSCSSDESSSDDEEKREKRRERTEAQNLVIEYMREKTKHPSVLSSNLWYNEAGEANDHPHCRCSPKDKLTGIRHDIFPGEEPYPFCDPHTNNAGRLHHYVVSINPNDNFLSDNPTVITYDDREYLFEGFSFFTHYPLDDFIPCEMTRFHIEYTLDLKKEEMPENFCIEEIDFFTHFLLKEILELYDFDYGQKMGGCQRFHVMPRFARLLPNNGKEILSMHQVIRHVLRSHKLVVAPNELEEYVSCSFIKWLRFTDHMLHSIVYSPGKKPQAIRVDQVDRDAAKCTEEEKVFPVIIHTGRKPIQFSYMANPLYRTLTKRYRRTHHLIFNKGYSSEKDRQLLIELKGRINKMIKDSEQDHELASEIGCDQVYMTGLKSDICQQALMLPMLANHVRYLKCLDVLNVQLGNVFTNKINFKRALTHPSYHHCYGMNSDHIRASQFNCGMKNIKTGDIQKMMQESRKKGVVTLIKIMSQLAESEAMESSSQHYERLEFLGDAVIQFLTSVHLFYMFPDVEEGGLAIYRQALVENQHLAHVGQRMGIGRFLLYSHGPDLCRSAALKHAYANAVESLMAAIYLDAGMDAVRRVFGEVIFAEEDLTKIWLDHPKHLLQMEYPDGDRHLIKDSPVLQELMKFEKATGISFKHVRLLAKALTQRHILYNDLTKGHNQRFEFLGDAVIQLVVSEYVYKFFPHHHEGHLSLLRSCVVSNKTQAIVAGEIGLQNYLVCGLNPHLSGFQRRLHPGANTMLSTKNLADLLEALIGAMYVDRGLETVNVFCEVLFFPRLKEFIMTQDWNDDKCHLQQILLTLRKEGKDPDLPVYKILKMDGPSNCRAYTVGVYFRNKRIGTGSGQNLKNAEKAAAKNALEIGNYIQANFQKDLLAKLYPDRYPDGAPINRRKKFCLPSKSSVPKQYSVAVNPESKSKKKRKRKGKAT